jgi:murein DD-endopeptidase MepM/ murein hydrolase activator NlpD
VIKKRLALIGLFVALAAFFGLSFLSQYPLCGGYGDWQTSPYVLPYPTGQSYSVHQGNCSLGGHHSGYRYSYDFLMPIGAPVTAARAGVVAETLEGHADGDAVENWVKVRHADGTIAAYSHLQSVAVAVGEGVEVGEVLGLSGNTGQTGGVPHLHFQVSGCSEPVNCGTLPVTFRNTAPNPRGLRAQQSYTALANSPSFKSK